jgi:Zn-finger nucleic acid-binding protein/DNA-directed RNA polymerase subunit RPC12/RpoP
MRLLIACPTCRRQYDASAKAPGETFACVCGASVEVRAARPHDAAVVRCSSCGSTRSTGEPACRWCGSEFTLDEQDLNTVCPQCFTRIGDRARHCHACGVAVAPQPIGAVDPNRPCPVCPGGPALRHRTLAADLAVLECARCGGLWLVPGTLRALVARVRAGADQAASLLGPLGGAGERTEARGDPGGPLYRACVICSERMNRTRFAGRTPVVVDYCREHGVWFDHQELAIAMEALAQGRAELDPSGDGIVPSDRARRLDRERRREGAASWPSMSQQGGRTMPWQATSFGVDVLSAILGFFRW